MLNPKLPPGKKWRSYELRALGLRDFAQAKRDSPLNPFKLAKFASLLVVDFEQIKGLSYESKQRLVESAVDEWSGGASSRPLPNGKRIVILNPKHGRMRTNATLMEEISHVFLGHRPNRLAFEAEATSKLEAREYSKADEEAAYAIGAAALVPYESLRKFIHQGKQLSDIARHFQVSRQLVDYRLKVTRLWPLYKASQLPRQ